MVQYISYLQISRKPMKRIKKIEMCLKETYNKDRADERSV